jgi:hypothetical protein
MVLKRSTPRAARVSGLVIDGRALPKLASYHAASAAAAAALGSFVASGASANAVADVVDLSAAAPVERSRALDWSSIASRNASTCSTAYPRLPTGGFLKTTLWTSFALSRLRKSNAEEITCRYHQLHPRNSCARRAVASQKSVCVRPPH